MHSHYKFGLFICLILTLSIYITHAAPKNLSSSYYEDDYDELEDYYDENETNDAKDINGIHRINSETTTTTTNRPPPPFADKKDIPKRSNHVTTQRCPKACICLEDFKYLQCSNSRLTSVPHDLPSTAHIIDLSHNNITKISAGDFANCTKLIEINLNYNQLQELDKESFSHMRNLQRLSMSYNRLTQIHPDTFSAARDMRTLDLSHNQIILPAETSFLNQPNLLELHCRNCSWTQLYDKTFTNMSSLTTLKLDLNNFSKKINTNAFIPLRNLLKLKLPDLDQSSIQQLCNLLKSIDNISFKHFDVTCFELVLGTSFNESLILATDPTYIAPNTPADKTKNKIKTETEKGKGTTQIAPTQVHHNKKEIMEKKSNLTVVPNEDLKLTNTSVLAADVSHSANDNPETYQVPVSQKTINIMLISIMIIALFGLLIGIVCRKDVGGIKTKCCRTRKDEPKNQIPPQPEEIPLNKIENTP